MKISIIIPVYNVEKYLEECIKSIINQTYQNLEIILIDDGSTDNSFQICEKYYKIDSRIKLVHKNNGGLSDARNYGLELATGEYIMFVDSDDFLFDNYCVEKICNQLNDFKIDVLIIGYKKYIEELNTFISNKKSLNEKYAEYSIEIQKKVLLQKNYYKACAWDKIVKREIIIDNKLVFPIGILSEDIEWCSNLLCLPLKIGILQDNIYVYRQRKGSISKTVSIKHISNIVQMCEKALLCEKEKLELECKKNYLSYYAYEYSVLLGLQENIKLKNKNKELYERVIKLKELLNYKNSNKVKIVYIFSKLFGVKITAKILAKFIKIKNV